LAGGGAALGVVWLMEDGVGGVGVLATGSIATASSPALPGWRGPAGAGSTARGSDCATALGGASFTPAHPTASAKERIPTRRTGGIIFRLTS